VVFGTLVVIGVMSTLLPARLALKATAISAVVNRE
jgi:hypothetical protein